MLKRKKSDKTFTLNVHADGVVYIGKEANKIDEQELDVKQAQVFVNEYDVYEFLLNLTPEKAREIGIKHRSALDYLKEKAKVGKLNLKSKNVRYCCNLSFEKMMGYIPSIISI